MLSRGIPIELSAFVRNSRILMGCSASAATIISSPRSLNPGNRLIPDDAPEPARCFMTNFYGSRYNGNANVHHMHVIFVEYDGAVAVQWSNMVPPSQTVTVLHDLYIRWLSSLILTCITAIGTAVTRSNLLSNHAKPI
jgi:hypothetical protein